MTDIYNWEDEDDWDMWPVVETLSQHDIEWLNKIKSIDWSKIAEIILEDEDFE